MSVTGEPGQPDGASGTSRASETGRSSRKGRSSGTGEASETGEAASVDAAVRARHGPPPSVGRVTEHDQAREALIVIGLTASAVVACSVTAGGGGPLHVDADLIPHPAAATLVGCLGVAAVTPALVRIDVGQRRLPNVLVGVVAVAWVASIVLSLAVGDVVLAVRSIGFVAVTALAGVAMAVAGGMGMGDVKLGALLTGLVSPWGSIALLGLWGLAGASGVVSAVTRTVRIRLRRPQPGAEPTSVAAGVPFGPCLLGAYWAVVIGRAVLATLVGGSTPS